MHHHYVKLLSIIYLPKMINQINPAFFLMYLKKLLKYIQKTKMSKYRIIKMVKIYYKLTYTLKPKA